jgi:hypothetical protein
VKRLHRRITVKAIKIFLIIYVIFSIPPVCFAASKISKTLKQIFPVVFSEFTLDQEAMAAKYGNDKPFTDYGFVAHAGGALFEDSKIYTYTNCREAVLYNYDKGYRVFEIDFNVTSDGKLAAVHSWEDARNITALTPPL